MIKLAVDEDFDARVRSGLRRRLSFVDAITVQEAGLTGALDPEILEWAARENRVLLSHDVSTIADYAYEIVDRCETMPGLILVPNRHVVSQTIEDLLTLLELADEQDLVGQVQYLPLRGGPGESPDHH